MREGGRRTKFLLSFAGQPPPGKQLSRNTPFCRLSRLRLTQTESAGTATAEHAIL